MSTLDHTFVRPPEQRRSARASCASTSVGTASLLRQSAREPLGAVVLAGRASTSAPVDELSTDCCDVFPGRVTGAGATSKCFGCPWQAQSRPTIVSNLLCTCRYGLRQLGIKSQTPLQRATGREFDRSTKRNDVEFECDYFSAAARTSQTALSAA